MSTKTIREELLLATKIKPKADESSTDLAARVATHISEKVSEEDYAKLSKGAQDWYSKAVEAAGAEKDVPELPDTEAASPKKTAPKKAPAKTAPKKAAAKKAPAKTAPKKAPAKTAPKKAAAKKAPAKEASEPRLSGSDVMRALLCKNMNMTKEQLVAKLEEKGIELAPVQVDQVYRQTYRVLELLKEMGKL